MNAIALQFANGNAFFLGVILATGMSLLMLTKVPRLMGSVLGVFSLVGAVLVASSATPIPVALQVSWGILLVGTLAVCRRRFEKAAPLRMWAAGILVAVSVVLVGVELPHRSAPSIPIDEGEVIYVIGDSISAGYGGSATNWPETMAAKYGLAVTNLARAGATAELALRQADGIADGKSVVILEIGGNDLLGRTSAEEFGRQLEQLLRKVSAGNRRVVMFELPLFPFSNGFGEQQRRLARQFNVALIPKRYMARVLCAQGATADGLHLSQKGHELMADVVWSLLTPTCRGEASTRDPGNERSQ